jgi:hypothetical protein
MALATGSVDGFSEETAVVSAALRLIETKDVEESSTLRSAPT